MLNIRGRAARQREIRGQLRMMELTRSRLRVLLRQEFRRTRREAASFLPSWEEAIRLHQIRLRRIMGTELRQAARRSMERTRGIARRALPLLVERKDAAASGAELDAEIDAWAEQYAAQRVVDISETTRKRLRREVRAGLDANETIPEIAARLADDVSIDDARAETIARTESHIAGMTGQHMTMEQTADDLGVDMVKEWAAVEDCRTRPDHADADGEQVDMDASFNIGDASLDYPGDPAGPPEEIINCRCCMLYNIK